MEVDKQTIENIPVLSCNIKDAREYSELLKEYIIKENDEFGHECYSLNKWYYAIVNNTKIITWNTKGFVHFIILDKCPIKSHYRINTRKNTIDYVDNYYSTAKELLKSCINTDKSKLN